MRRFQIPDLVEQHLKFAPDSEFVVGIVSAPASGVAQSLTENHGSCDNAHKINCVSGSCSRMRRKTLKLAIIALVRLVHAQHAALLCDSLTESIRFEAGASKGKKSDLQIKLSI